MKIEPNVIQDIITQAKAELPNESCGYLLGKDDLVSENYPMENIDHSPEHFSFAPKEQFRALKYARNKGLKILANWHSHPNSPSRPSTEDLRLANDPNIYYVILSFMDGLHLNAFKIINGEIEKKEVLYQEPSY